MPDEAYEHPEALLELIRHVGCLDGCLGSIYIESRLDTNWEEQVSSTVLALALYNKNRSGARPEAGFKLRCGGLTASSFPSLDQVAFVLASCRDAAVPFKATAGLHHPVRQYDASVRTHRHGFINIFCAGVMAHSLKLDTDEICEILAEVDTEAFSFTESGFSWKTRHVSLQQLAKARTTFAHSYGSCNFDDPRQDLKHAGLLLTFDAI
jgi:hypothetical protein